MRRRVKSKLSEKYGGHVETGIPINLRQDKLFEYHLRVGLPTNFRPAPNDISEFNFPDSHGFFETFRPNPTSATATCCSRRFVDSVQTFIRHNKAVYSAKHVFTNKLSMYGITPAIMWAGPKVISSRLLKDSGCSLEKFLSKEIGYCFNKTENRVLNRPLDESTKPTQSMSFTIVRSCDIWVHRISRHNAPFVAFGFTRRLGFGFIDKEARP